MPNAGKSSLFNALTKAAQKPRTTRSPRSSRTSPSCRCRTSACSTSPPSPARPTSVLDQIHVHDIAGLVKGASKGEGLGNQFLANIRETDAILHVVRAHEDGNVVHPEGDVDPIRDIETIETELIFADLDQAERRLERVSKDGEVARPRSDRRRGVAERRRRRAAVGQARPHGADARGRAARTANLSARSPASPSCSSPTSPRARPKCRRRSPSTRSRRAPKPSRSAPAWKPNSSRWTTKKPRDARRT